MEATQNLNIIGTEPLVFPEKIKQLLPLTENSNKTVVQSRQAIKNILKKKDKRLLLIIGPCSIHHEMATYEYAKKLNQFRKVFADEMEIIMRVYFEKPRTTVGWKGLINDPHLDGSFQITTGLKLARKILLEITGIGLPAATEFLDPIVPQYIDDLISWSAVGARTTESQTHREMSSGLSMPVGFKNNTDGSLQVAIDAMEASRHPHHFLGVDKKGHLSIIKTKGNPFGHIVLRGGKLRPNYDPKSISNAVKKLSSAGLNPAIMVDCSHANSGKKHEKQQVVWKNIIAQRLRGNDAIIGLMLESHLLEGNQKITENIADLSYGISVTDACISFETTEKLLHYAYKKIKKTKDSATKQT